MTTMFRSVVLSCVCFVCAPAAAQDGGAVAAAEAAFQRGEQSFAQGAFAQAEREFRSAHELMSGHPNRPLILVNIARSIEEQGGRDAEALSLYERMLEETQGASGEGAQNARRIAQERAGALRARGVSDGPAISAVGLIVMAGGAAALITGAIAGAIALAQREDVLSMCSGTRCPPALEDDAAQIDDIALAADVLLFGGAAIAVTGLILTFVLPSDESLMAAATCGPASCYAALRGSFE
jgi:hypothetical protein